MLPLDIVYGKEPLFGPPSKNPSSLCNPHYVCDGMWGGLGGRRLWHRGVYYDLPKDNVYQDDWHGKWVRAWDNARQVWRKVSRAEKKALGKAPKVKAKVRWGAMGKTLPGGTAEQREALAAFLIRPIYQVIGEAPALTNLFKDVPTS